ncbi:MAG: M56 family metallopeptidase [Tepidisphaerales bacterium]
MTGLITFLCEHGLMLLAGSTAMLAGGTIVAAIVRSPAHRQRIAECSVAAVIVWAVLACVPMRRVEVWPARPQMTPVGAPSPSTITRVQPPTPDAILFDGQIPPEVIAGAQPEPTPIPAVRLSAGQTAAAVAVRALPVQPARPIRWDRMAAWAFVVGAGAMAGWLLIGRVVLWRVIARSETPAAWLGELFASLPKSRRLRPQLLVSPALSRPVSFGLWRACIVLPASLADPTKRQCVRQVLLHELAHLCRGDGWGNLVLNLGMIGLYFHPLYWWLRAQAGLSRELVADDWAARQSDRQTYVQELIVLARMNGGGLQAAATMGILGSTSQFYRRMHMLLGRQTVLATRCSRVWRIAMAAGWSVAVIGAAALMGVGPAGAQDAPAPERPLPGMPGAAVGMPVPPGNHSVPGGAPAAAREEDAKVTNLPTSASVRNYVMARELDRLTEAEFKLGGALRDAQMMYERVKALADKGKPILEVEKALESEASAAAMALSQLRIKRDEAVDQYSKDHPNVKKLERLIELTRSQYDARREELRVKYTNLIVESLKDQVAQTQADLESVQKRLDLLRREFEIKAAEEHDPRSVTNKARTGAGEPPNPIGSGGLPPGTPRVGRGGLGLPAADPTIPNHIPATPTQAAAPAAVGGVQLDLVNLANSAVTSVGTLHLAEVDLARMKQLANTHTVSQEELSHAETNFQTAKRRVDLFRGLVKVALSAAERELKTAHAEYTQGLAPRTREDEAATKIEMLKLILGSME